ncbi:MAG TPA: hypothetical protein VK021_04925 [Flavobacteriaceae bacterium]|nr:hypothetical protein [Flavobacteriaceae bacterium]
MILIFTQKITPRKTYIFNQILKEILGLEIRFTKKIEEFIACKDWKFSYGDRRMGNEFFVKSSGLLDGQSVVEMDIQVKDWHGVPCFFEDGEDGDIPFDIFSASFYMLSRYEEYLPHPKDELGRFPAKESLAFKNNFLKRPVVDLWAYKFKDALESHFPELEVPARKFGVKNVLSVAELYKYHKKGLMRNLGGGINDFFQLRFKEVFERIRTQVFWTQDPYDVYDELLKFSKQHKIKWNFLFQLSDYSMYNKNIGYNRQVYHAMIKSMGDYGNIGLLVGYEAVHDLNTLRKEKRRWENIANQELKMAMTNDYGVNLPDLYNNYDSIEIPNDFSMGFPEKIGFRAGTCTPYLYYELNLERISPLVIQPTVFNSKAFLPKSFFEVKTVLDRIKAEVKSVEGQFIMVYKNTDFADGQRKEKFLQILERMND